MPKCIYCGSEDITVEHPLPRGLGNFRGYVPLIDRVCTRCNGICGQLDEQLCRSGGEAFFRKFLGVSGRCVKLTGEDDSENTITITDGMTPEEFRKKVKALGITFFKHAYITAAPDEIPWVDQNYGH
jgi:hypothetical protein